MVAMWLLSTSNMTHVTEGQIFNLFVDFTLIYLNLLLKFYFHLDTIDLQSFAIAKRLGDTYTYINKSVFFLRFFSFIGYYRILSRVPCAIQ